MPTAETAPVSAYFSLHPQLQKNIVSRLGWRTLRPVQECAIPPLLAGDDAIILAPTAGGKTESAMFALLSKVISQGPQEGPQIIYLCPLKALINNLLTRLQTLCGLVDREAFSWHGEVSQNHRQNFLAEPKSLLLTTPESLQVILSRPNIDLQQLFGRLQAVVIDEVHAFCGEDRGDQLMALLSQLDRWAGRPVQRVGLSATVGNPGELLDWISGDRGTGKSLVDPLAGNNKKQPKLLEVHPVGKELDSVARLAAAMMRDTPKSLFFVDSRRQSEQVQAGLSALGVEALAHHSSLSQELREKTEEVFRGSARGSRRPKAIVCTSTLELGLDVGDIDKVFQLGAPSTVSAFLQRLGRAGRREDSMAHLVFLTDEEDSFLRALSLISLAMARVVEPVHPSTRSFTVLAQQILLQLLREGALRAETLWQHIWQAPPFRNISLQERDRLLEHMLEQEWLSRQDGRLALGPRTEKEHGRSNYMELLSVFSGGTSVKVQTEAGRVIGSLDYGVALSVNGAGKSFLLGGGSWKPKRWDPLGKTLIVVASAGGEPLRWTGGKAEIPSRLVRESRNLLSGSQPFAFLGKSAQARLAQLREQYAYLDDCAPLVRASQAGDTPRVTIEQWAGTAVHRTLATAISGWLGCDYRADARTFQLECSLSALTELLTSARQQDWHDFCLAGLKSYRGRHLTRRALPKFHDLLPAELQEECALQGNYAVRESESYWRELFACKVE